jgi:MFS family permease
MGFSFLIGIVIGCLTVARLGDIYGRKPIYKLGLCMHLLFTVIICFLKTSNIYILYALLVFFGMSLKAGQYVGYSFNIEM